MKQKLGALVAASALVLCFQNCSANKVAFDAGTSSAASTSPNGSTDGVTDPTTTTPTTTTPTTTTPTTGDVLGTIKFLDITKVTFDGSLDLYWAGVYNTSSILTLDHTQHSFNAVFSADGLRYIPTLSCHSQGTLSDYNNLENALQNLTFSINHTAAAYDFVAASMKIYLKNGTVKTYQIDTGVTQISVDGVSHIDAKAFKSLMKALLFNAGCSY